MTAGRVCHQGADRRLARNGAAHALHVIAVVVACALTQAGVAVAQSRVADLSATYVLARDSDPTFLAARNEFEAATFAEPQARAALLPTLGYELAKTETRQEILNSKNAVFGQGFSKYPSDSRTLTLTQPIFKMSAWRGYEQAKTKVAQAGAVFTAAEQDLMLRTATAYLNVLAARDSLGFAEAERTAIKSQLDLVQQRYESKLVTIVGLHDARARHALKESDVVVARKELNDQLQALRELTGNVLTDLRQVRDDLPLDPPIPADVEQWVTSALEKNVLIEARRLGVEVARQEIQRQDAGHAPVLDLVLTNNKKETGGSLFGGGSTVATTDVLVRLTVPIYSGGMTSALAGEARSRYSQAQNLLERDRRQVERQTRTAFEGVASGIARVRALGESVMSQESARRLKEEGYKAGLQTILAVLDAERDLFSAKRDAAKARYEFLLNRLRLQQAVGSLDESDLAAINRGLRQ